MILHRRDSQVLMTEMYSNLARVKNARWKTVASERNPQRTYAVAEDSEISLNRRSLSRQALQMAS